MKRLLLHANAPDLPQPILFYEILFAAAAPASAAGR